LRAAGSLAAPHSSEQHQRFRRSGGVFPFVSIFKRQLPEASHASAERAAAVGSAPAGKNRRPTRSVALDLIRGLAVLSTARTAAPGQKKSQAP